MGSNLIRTFINIKLLKMKWGIKMAKKQINLSYTNANLDVTNEEQQRYVLTETTKDDIKVYDLSAILNSLVGQDNVSITIKTTDEIPSDDIETE